MKENLKNHAAIFVATVVSAILAAETTFAETKVRSTVESRVVLAYAANGDGVQALMPHDWKAITLPQGPMEGANVLISIFDKHLTLDSDGKLLQPTRTRAVAIVAFGVQKGVSGARTFILQTYEPEPISNPFLNSVAADISHSMTMSGPAGGPVSYSEAWDMVVENGGELSLDLSYVAGVSNWTAGESVPYSNVEPDLHEIYRYTQMANLVKSEGMGIGLNGQFEFSTTIPDLEPIFDGSEELKAIIALPVYIRDVYKP